jgi:hypothetical protein
LYSFIAYLPDYFRRRYVEHFADPADRWETHHLPFEHLGEGLMGDAGFGTDLNLSHLGLDHGGCESLGVYD